MAVTVKALRCPCAAPRRTSRRCRAGAATAARTGPAPRSSAGANSGRASSAVTGWRRSASATTPTVSARCGEQVAYSTTPPGRVSRDRRRPAARAAAWPARATSAGVRRQRASGRRRSAPSPVHGASTRTRSKLPGSQRRSSRPSTRSTSTGRPRVFCSTSSARRGGGLDRGDPRALLGGDRREQRRLAAGPGAQVQPAAAVVADQRRQRQRAGHQLAALVLDQRLRRRAPARAGRGHRRRQVHRIRRVAADRRRRPLRPAAAAVSTPGPGGQVHRRPGVVGGQRGVEFARRRRRARRRRPGRSSADGRARTPGGRSGRWPRTGPARPPRTASSRPAIVRSTRVDETRSGRVEFDTGLLDGGGHRGVLRRRGCAAAGRRPAAAGPAAPGRSGRPGARPRPR